MLLGTINFLPGLWMSFIVLNCQVVEWVDIFANPVFKNPGIYKNERNTQALLKIATRDRLPRG